jgi:hypothetical protein
MDDSTKRVARRYLRAAADWRAVKRDTERAEWKLESSIKPQIAALWKKAYPKMERLIEQDIEDELGKAGYKVVSVRVSGLHHYMDYDLEKWDCEIHGEVESLVQPRYGGVPDESGDPEVLDTDELIETLSDEVGIWDGLTAKVGRKTTVFSGKDVRLSG